eukprot:567944-Prymnesium_polylepis.1
MRTLDTDATPESTTDSHAFVSAASLWQVLQSVADAAPAPQTPSMHDAALKSQPTNLSLVRTVLIEPLTGVRAVLMLTSYKRTSTNSRAVARRTRRSTLDRVQPRSIRSMRPQDPIEYRP